MDNSGIILKKGLADTLNPLDGELEFAEDTDEIFALENGVKTSRPKIPKNKNKISIKNGILDDLLGTDGDWVLGLGTSSEYKDYFKIGVWVERPEGFTENYLLTNFGTKVDWSGYITRDGSVKFNSSDYETKTLTDNSIVVKKVVDQEILDLQNNSIRVDGTVKMIGSYIPVEEGDVLDIKSLKNPDVLFFPPTIEPSISGAIWNDSGVLKFSRPTPTYIGPLDIYQSYDFVEMSEDFIYIFKRTNADNYRNFRICKIYSYQDATIVEEVNFDPELHLESYLGVTKNRKFTGSSGYHEFFIFDETGQIIEKTINLDDIGAPGFSAYDWGGSETGVLSHPSSDKILGLWYDCYANNFTSDDALMTNYVIAYDEDGNFINAFGNPTAARRGDFVGGSVEPFYYWHCVLRGNNLYISWEQPSCSGGACKKGISAHNIETGETLFYIDGYNGVFSVSIDGNFLMIGNRVYNGQNGEFIKYSPSSQSYYTNGELIQSMNWYQGGNYSSNRGVFSLSTGEIAFPPIQGSHYLHEGMAFTEGFGIYGDYLIEFRRNWEGMPNTGWGLWKV